MNSGFESKAERTKTRLISVAIHRFSDADFEEVKIVDIAADAHLTSQGVYRYFTDKLDLYITAARAEFDSLNRQVLSEIVDEILPHFTGVFWRVYSQCASERPFLYRVFARRDAAITAAVLDSPSVQELHISAHHDFIVARREHLIRDDIAIESMSATVGELGVRVLVPYLFSGKYLDSDWVDMERVLTAAIMYPLPDLDTPVGRAELEHSVQKIVERLAQKEKLSV